MVDTNIIPLQVTQQRSQPRTTPPIVFQSTSRAANCNLRPKNGRELTYHLDSVYLYKNQDQNLTAYKNQVSIQTSSEKLARPVIFEMVAFCLGGCDFNKNGWGPTRLPEQYLNLPYASFGKSDRLGKAADFTSNAHYHRYRPRHDVTGVNTEFQYKHDTQEDASFQLVDTVKGVRSKFSTRLRPFSSRVGRVHARFPQQQRRQPATQTDPHVRQKGQQQLNKRWDRLSKARRQYNTRRREEKRTDREASVQVNAEWKVIEQFDLSQLTKLSTAAPEVSDVKWCGSKFTYDDMYDRVSTRSEKPLAKFPDRDFYYVSTTDDPVIEDMAVEGKVKVFATDVILAHLMTSPRSVYPWDIVVNRVGDALFFDKREESKFDLLTVDETAFDSPNDEVLESINHPESLSIEATIINQNFSQQILKPETKEDLDNPSPFVEPNSCPAAAAYRYRQWDFTDEISLVARCELHGEAEKRGQKELFTAYALNEWDSKISKSTDYRMKIDAQVRRIFKWSCWLSQNPVMMTFFKYTLFLLSIHEDIFTKLTGFTIQ